MTIHKNTLSAEHARQLLVRELKLKREDTVFTHCMMEHDPQGDLFHICMTSGLTDYECYVDAETGEVRGLITAPCELGAFWAETPDLLARRA